MNIKPVGPKRLEVIERNRPALLRALGLKLMRFGSFVSGVRFVITQEYDQDGASE